MNCISWSFLLFLGVSALENRSAHAPVVSAKTGKIRGIRKYYKRCCMNVYFGIPFAKPPVGDLRFKRPLPVEPWSDVLNATKKPPACPQVPFDADSLDKESSESEDCLYLNIWAPCSRGKKAVMVWIYGGSFAQGSNSMSIYDGSELVTRGNVILVSINYRMSAFGFATSNTEDAPGNAGMYDQAEALKWIHDNIEEFGGNASCITLFGQSAGSMSISMHTVSPLTSKLFHRAIMESGSCATQMNVFEPARNLNSTDALAKAVGCSSSVNSITTNAEAVMDCLRKKDMDTLRKHATLRDFFPQYGDSFMPTHPRNEIMNGNSKNCDRLIGVTYDEGTTFWARTLRDTYGNYGEKVQHPILNKTQARSMMKQTEFPFAISPGVAESMIDYSLSKVEGDNNEEVLRQAHTAIGDIIIVCPSVYEAEKAAQRRNKVYFYRYSHRSTYAKTGEWTGVTHFSEVPYVFGVPIQGNNSGSEMLYTNEEKTLSRNIISIWTSFAKSGCLNCSDTPWPLYSREQPSYCILNTTKRFEIGQGPHRDNCNFLRKFYGFS